MKVILAGGEVVEVNESYGARLIEQREAALAPEEKPANKPENKPEPAEAGTEEAKAGKKKG